MKNDIWQKVGRKHGFTDPGDDYFERFTERMAAQLPELEFPQKPAVTLWSRVQVWVYMAAMFAGIALMVRIFAPAPKSDIDFLAEEQSQQAFYDELIWTSCINNCDVYEYLADAYDY